MTMVLPNQFKMETATGPTNVSTYSVGDGFTYMHMSPTSWLKMATPAAQVAAMTAQMTAMAKSNPSTVRVLPDRVEDGVTVGVYQSTGQIPATPMMAQSAPKETTVTCSYDKQTYLTKKCSDSAGQYLLTFSHYNDPANVIVLPPEAKSATLLNMQMPAGPASPPPGL
jgi:hypothetical protein